MTSNPLECPSCEGHGAIVFEAGASGYGDPETVEVEEECEECGGSGDACQRCVDCGELVDLAKTCQVLRGGETRCVPCAEEEARESTKGRRP
jgi:DnaJ-class molecular chaperone